MRWLFVWLARLRMFVRFVALFVRNRVAGWRKRVEAIAVQLDKPPDPHLWQVERRYLVKELVWASTPEEAFERSRSFLNHYGDVVCRDDFDTCRQESAVVRAMPMGRDRLPSGIGESYFNAMKKRRW